VKPLCHAAKEKRSGLPEADPYVTKESHFPASHDARAAQAQSVIFQIEWTFCPTLVLALN
jgi:hypothetical protein